MRWLLIATFGLLTLNSGTQPGANPPGTQAVTSHRGSPLQRTQSAAIDTGFIRTRTGVMNDEQNRAEVDGETAAVAPFGIPTMGGRQFWGDICFHHGWRIQRHFLTRHCRLISPDNYRFANGDEQQCLAALEVVKKRQALPPLSGRVVICIHGIIRSSRSFNPMKSDLEARGYTVIPFDYPSTRVPLEDTADQLRTFLNHLPDVSSIDFVVHSMGGLVVREYYRGTPDQRIRRMVMLGTPNHGAEIADIMRNNLLYQVIYGPAGSQLGTSEEEGANRLPIPACEFAVIAGGKSDGEGFNPLLPGDDDGTVTVASARLEGAADFMVVNRLHSFLMGHPDVIQATGLFLDSGCLRSDEAPQPIRSQD